MLEAKAKIYVPDIFLWIILDAFGLRLAIFAYL